VVRETTIKSTELTHGSNLLVKGNNGKVTIEFFVGVPVNLTLKVIEIDAQIAPGWIE
jgi:hypothetical protein